MMMMMMVMILVLEVYNLPTHACKTHRYASYSLDFSLPHLVSRCGARGHILIHSGGGERFTSFIKV